MPGTHFKFSVSSLSCAPANILRPLNILVPSYATQQTIRRLIHMRHRLRNIIPVDEFTTSLHAGYMIANPLAFDELQQHQLPISSVDTPDVVSIEAFIKELSRNVLAANMKCIKTTIGWQFASVSNYREYNQKVFAGIDGINSNDSVHFVRASTGSWYKSALGKRLIDMIASKRKNRLNLALAVEIDARHQTPEEYFQFVYDLGIKNPEVPVYFDLDVGHIAEARKRHRHKNIEKAEIIVERLLNNKKYNHLIGIISLNQYDYIKDETHISLMKGSIDYVHILKLLGEAGRAGNLTIEPTILAEFSPFEYGEMISPEGIAYFDSLKKSYLQKH
ncbi:hypothetical protein BH09PAT2_BH09PAT2_05740 [soil metagenome]